MHIAIEIDTDEFGEMQDKLGIKRELLFKQSIIKTVKKSLGLTNKDSVDLRIIER